MRALLCVALLAPSIASAQDCASDDALERAAQAMIATSVDASALLETVRAAGSDAPLVDALVIRDGDPARRQRFLARVAERRRAPLACGEARNEERWIVLAAPRAGRIVRIDEARVRIELASGWRGARLYAQDGEGSIWQSEVRHGELVVLPDSLAEPLTLQLLAENENGPLPIAELRIGQRTPIAESDEPIAARIAALREDALRENRLLAREATQHARNVCAERTVSHRGEGGDPRERLARAGIRARHVGEVVARAQTEPSAYAALLASPSHRAALADRRFTDIGIGTARADAHTCLVVLLASWPRAVPYAP